jgi:amino acid transporter
LAADMMSVLYGPTAGRLVTVAVLISILAALNGSILSGARVPYAMARGGFFFKSIAKVHPRFHTPGNSIIVLCAWSSLVLLSGWYDNLYRYVIFGSWILYLLATASVFVLRRKRPDLARPYRVVGYPWVPASFVLVAGLLLVSSLQTYPRESLMGLVLMLLGVPFYWHWRRRVATSASGLPGKPTN